MKNFKKLLIILVLMLMAVCVLISPLFNAVSTTVTGLNRLNESEIRALTGLEGTVNLFRFDSGTVKKKLLDNKYIKKVDVIKDYGRKAIELRIVERVLSGYVQYPGGIYLYIDDNGFVLESATYYTERLPLVVGLKVDEFKVGKPLKLDNDKLFQMVVTFAQLFNEYELESDVIKVDVTDPKNIHLYIGKVDIEFGDFGNISDTDEKIRFLKAMLPSLPDTNSIIDLKDITNKPAIFRLLT